WLSVRGGAPRDVQGVVCGTRARNRWGDRGAGFGPRASARREPAADQNCSLEEYRTTSRQVNPSVQARPSLLRPNALIACVLGTILRQKRVPLRHRFTPACRGLPLWARSASE